VNAPQAQQQTVLETLAEAVTCDPPPPLLNAMSITDVQVQLCLVQSELKKIRKEASSFRCDMLQERAAAEALAENEDKAKIL
jgi:hypothetical protein